MIKSLALAFAVVMIAGNTFAEEMDASWGESTVKLRADNAERGELFDEGNYAMFIHWGLYSQLGNQVDGKTYYGIGEWIMDPKMAGIPVDQYKELAGTFNPVDFDAEAIAKLAKDAGMKYIVITAKHHDGFAMYDSAACDFNIVDATPWKTDPMKELSAACRDAGLGFGFYYSHSQDWTFPGGRKGPTVDADGNPATFADYFTKKCVPQVKELTTEYGPIELIWFDTPGGMKKEYVQELVDIVRKNQPHALVSGRAGHDLGDYQTLGDMEVPHHNVEGMWEAVDTTNDSWAYAWYDQRWKTPHEILHRLISCVGRGGTYMLNVGPDGNGVVPERAARSLREAGEWIRRYPRVVYGTDASPWGHAMPWGDITVKGNRLFLSVFDWPESGQLFLPGLNTEIESARLLDGKEHTELSFKRANGWTLLEVPSVAPEQLASVIELILAGEPDVDSTFGIDPNLGTEIRAEFSSVTGAKIAKDRWMEKFGEWVCEYPATQWSKGGKAVWEIDILVPGDYDVELSYTGEGRLVWGVDVVGGEHIQNQQNASHNYQEFPIGWLNFPTPGRYKIAVSCLEGNIRNAELRWIRLTPLNQFSETLLQASTNRNSQK
ncbi:alpha-L-fucosidase [Rhodopirellula sp. SWK7]|uniref:alpha-L-fucosidase n=1 Tax=Rhodopirellula sp. SWK7 TaxID=595460 RepID=UPI0002BF129E|nr:alpha-L-fucosidase [Rhodopirellula sp. SWK7]EMI43292.1 glycosyl hydrolase [Rhodopirellula sp. SWK7]